MHPSPPSPHHLATQRERLEALRSTLMAELAGRRHITLEIGSGHGHYLTAYAAAHPTTTCVGIDLLLDRHERSERKRERAGLKNLCFFRADAADFLRALAPEVRFDAVFVLFPDPWPKRRHHKNRLIQASFLSALATRVPAGGHLYFRTDDTDYFAAAGRTVRHHGEWKIDPDAPWPFELPTVFQQRADSFQSFVAARVAPDS